MQLLVRVAVGSSRRGGKDSGDMASRNVYLLTNKMNAAQHIWACRDTVFEKKQGEHAYP